MKTVVEFSPKAVKDLKQLPHYILNKIEIWVGTVEEIGIIETRKIKGFHDEPLKGKRNGQRSIRLNRKYRLFYTMTENKVNIAYVLEINNHEY